MGTSANILEGGVSTAQFRVSFTFVVRSVVSDPTTCLLDAKQASLVRHQVVKAGSASKLVATALRHPQQW